jgi:prepilin-type N-terminal cleavage/methylation domain-containing protein
MRKLIRNCRGFTLVEILIVVVMLAILFAIAVPIYSNYVAQARSAEAQEAISAVWAASKVHHAQNNRWPSKITEMRQLELDEVTKRRWNFTIIPGAQGISALVATSTQEMKGGQGKQIRFNVETGEWTGYGFDTY